MKPTSAAQPAGLFGGVTAPAEWISHLWSTYNNQRQGKIQEWNEYRNYVFATDTTTTSNSSLPWKNKTTLPKLCQLRDNLHANYKDSLIPNDEWIKWEGSTLEDSLRETVKSVEAYMRNKTNTPAFRRVLSQLLLDYIDYGNSFARVDYVTRYRDYLKGSERIPDYIGPEVTRVSPLDIVFDPTAVDFDRSFKVIRHIKTTAQMKAASDEYPDLAPIKECFDRRERMKTKGGYSKEDYNKAEGYSMDGLGNLYEYLMGDYVELLEFLGDFVDPETGELIKNRRMIVMDRCKVILDEESKSWFGNSPIYHVGWRKRPDSIWAMGPLDNLVGMQYRIDHLENLKADAMDLAVFPPLKVIGEVEEFVYAPNSQIAIDEGGDVGELGKNLNGVITADNQIAELEAKMELYAGAPREAMGVRSPGEKTAFEVQRLENASGRIFQEKIKTFEEELLEPLLNAMLESARRNLDAVDIARSTDKTEGVQEFLKITKEDITTNGRIRPIGARHFAAQAQLVQNLTGIFNSPLGEKVAPHMSNKALASLIEDVLGIGRFDLFRPNIAVAEAQETQELAGQMQEDSVTKMNSGADIQ